MPVSHTRDFERPKRVHAARVATERRCTMVKLSLAKCQNLEIGGPTASRLCWLLVTQSPASASPAGERARPTSPSGCFESSRRELDLKLTTG